MSSSHGNHGSPGTYRPTPGEVEELVRRAAGHPLGTDFLAQGSPDAVAATFGVHAFVVDAARTELAGRRAAGGRTTSV